MLATELIILSASQARMIRGESSPGHALDPRPLSDGRHVISTRVIDDPAHARHREFLLGLPRESFEQLAYQFAELDPPVAELVSVDILHWTEKHHLPDYVPKNGRFARPPVPGRGDLSPTLLFAAVGHAISAWENVELNLAHLFGKFAGDATLYSPASQAYGSIIASSARLKALKAAATAYFQIHTSSKLKSKMDGIAEDARSLVERRNDIAHGSIFEHGGGYVIAPPRFSPKYTKLLGGGHAPDIAYGYRVPEIRYFADQFSQLANTVGTFTQELD